MICYSFLFVVVQPLLTSAVSPYLSRSVALSPGSSKKTKKKRPSPTFSEMNKKNFELVKRIAKENKKKMKHT